MLSSCCSGPGWEHPRPGGSGILDQLLASSTSNDKKLSGVAARRILVELLNDADETVRQTSAMSLVSIRDSELIRDLIDACRSAAPPADALLVDVLRASRGRHLFEAIELSLQHGDAQERMSVARLLAQIGDRQGLPLLE